MDVITPGFIGPFSKYTIGWKKLRLCFRKRPETFFPSTHYASLSQFCQLSFKHDFNFSENSNTQGIFQKVKYIKGLNLQHSAGWKKKKEIFALFYLAIASSLLDHIAQLKY